MKIRRNHSYSVKDANGIVWGYVVLTEDTPGQLHGYLEPTPEFDAVYALFKRHGDLMSEEGEIDEVVEQSAQAIIDLRPMLHSADHVISAGMVFVGKTDKGYLFTCGQSVEQLGA